VNPYDHELDQGLVLGVGTLDEMRFVIEAARERDDAIRIRTAAEIAAVELAWRLADERRRFERQQTRDLVVTYALAALVVAIVFIGGTFGVGWVLEHTLPQIGGAS
jgi:chromosome condensin MukBEF ATPase and DNA-binding subunit MukB